MAVLVTRPAPDNRATAEALRARGYEPLLAPLLVFQLLPFRDGRDGNYGGVILTSANAVRAIAAYPQLPKLLGLPAFAVGARTAEAARAAGFRDVRASDGDAADLRELIAASAPAKKRAALLYPSAADVGRDLGGELGLRGIEVVSMPVYRMAELDDFAEPVREAFARQAIDAILHYSQRSAQAFVKATRRAGLEVSALALPQVCLSEAVARPLREAGAARLGVAKAPNEADLLAVLEQVLRSG